MRPATLAVSFFSLSLFGGAWGCGGGAAPLSSAEPGDAIPLVVPLPRAAGATSQGSAGAGPTAEPRCKVGGSQIHVAGDALRLCGEPGRRCFGILRGERRRLPWLESLELDSSLDARAKMKGPGVTIEANIAVPSIHLFPAGAYPIDGWFVSAGPPVAVTALRGDTVDVTAHAGGQLRPDAPLTARWPCSRLATDELRVSEREAIDAFGRGRDLQELQSSRTPVALRAVAGGPTVAWLDGLGLRGNVVARDAHEIRMRVALDGAWVVAWVDASAFEDSVPSGSHRLRPPDVRMGQTSYGFRCPYPVDVVFDTPDGEVRPVTLAPGTPFDPERIGNTLKDLFDMLPDAPAHVEPRELLACHDPAAP